MKTVNQLAQVVRKAVLSLVLAYGLTLSMQADDKPVVTLNEGWSNVFGGSEAVFHAAVTAKEGFAGRLGWRFSEAGRTVLQKEAKVDVKPGAVETVQIRLAVPEVKEGVVFEAVLTLSLIKEGVKDPVASVERRIWIFPADPFAGRAEWLKKAGIRLFDPEKKTARLFEEAKIPFEAVGNIDAFPEIKGGMLVIGEGVSFKEYRGLGSMMSKAAAAGVPVLCLAPAGGEATLPGIGDSDLPRPDRIVLERGDVIKRLDKRLDAGAWPPDGVVAASSLKLRGERGPVVGEVTNGGEGWSWVEMESGQGKTKFVICGFKVIEKWKTGPTPRFLFARALEYVAAREGP